MRTLLYVTCGVAVLAAVSGCGNGESRPRMQQFALDVDRGEAGPQEPLAQTLKVRSLRAAQPYQTNQFIYRMEDDRYITDYYHRLLVLPTALVTEETTEWLGDSGLFAHVLEAGSRVDAEYLLEGRILALLGDFSRPGQPEARVRIQYSLINQTGRDNAIALQRTYSEAIPIESKTAAHLVEGWDRGLQSILQALEADVRKTLSESARSDPAEQASPD